MYSRTVSTGLLILNMLSRSDYSSLTGGLFACVLYLYLQVITYVVLRSTPQEGERTFTCFEEAKWYARAVHLKMNCYVHILKDGHRTHCVKV